MEEMDAFEDVFCVLRDEKCSVMWGVRSDVVLIICLKLTPPLRRATFTL
jgi:hypothetical protein